MDNFNSDSKYLYFRPPLFSLEKGEVDEGEVHRTFIVECGEGRIVFVKCLWKNFFVSTSYKSMERGLQ